MYFDLGGQKQLKKTDGENVMVETVEQFSKRVFNISYTNIDGRGVTNDSTLVPVLDRRSIRQCSLRAPL